MRFFAPSSPIALSQGLPGLMESLWHATSEGDESDLRHINPGTGEVLEKLEMPQGVYVSGLESDGGDQFFCGGGKTGKVRVVRRPGVSKKDGSIKRRKRASGPTSAIV